MAKIELNHYDLYIETIKNREGIEVEVVKINNRLAFDEQFIKEMEENGVKHFVKYNEVNEEM